jgi:ribosome maturation factor RimP
MEVEAMVRPVVEAAGLELIDAALLREQGRRILRVTVDRDGGIDLETIGQLSERVSRRLDIEGFNPGPYSLEVSSPGMERPLREPRDFARRAGQRVKLKVSRPVDGAMVLTGTIVAADPYEVRLATEAGERSIAFEDITSARLVFDWAEELKGGKR